MNYYMSTERVMINESVCSVHRGVRFIEPIRVIGLSIKYGGYYEAYELHVFLDTFT